MGELIFTAILLICAVILLISSFSIPIVDDIAGARYWPMFLLVVCILLLTLKVIKAWKNLPADRKERIAQLSEVKSRGTVKLLLAFAICTVYVLIVSRIGFIFGTFLLGIGISWLLGAKKLHQMALAGLCASIPIYAIFVWILNLRLPRGIGVFYDISMWVERLL